MAAHFSYAPAIQAKFQRKMLNSHRKSAWAVSFDLASTKCLNWRAKKRIPKTLSIKPCRLQCKSANLLVRSNQVLNRFKHSTIEFHLTSEYRFFVYCPVLFAFVWRNLGYFCSVKAVCVCEYDAYSMCASMKIDEVADDEKKVWN